MRIGSKSVEWFPSFMWALRENGYVHLVKNVDEKIAYAGENESVLT